MLITLGNKKIGNDTYIMNLHPATMCAARDQCLVRNVCYALSNERLRPTVLPFRKRQETLWRTKPASYFIEEFKRIKIPSVKYIRFQEAGDFEDQDDLDKLSIIADALKPIYRCYTYTCRFDLDFSKKSDSLVITGSHFMVDNMFIPLKSEPYEMIMEETPNAIHCPGDCRKCTLCKTSGEKAIYQKMH